MWKIVLPLVFTALLQADEITTIAGNGQPGFSATQLNNPYGLSLGPDGGLYICEIGNHVDIGLPEEAGGGGQAESSPGAGSGALMLGVEESHEDGHALGIRELGEDDGEGPAPEELEERLDLRDDVAGGRHFHCLARIEEGALHVDDEQRRLSGSQL